MGTVPVTAASAASEPPAAIPVAPSAAVLTRSSCTPWSRGQLRPGFRRRRPLPRVLVLAAAVAALAGLFVAFKVVTTRRVI